ncbi:hypothetical protein DVH24_006530 [Malus domestica]|uniref:Uncharacterized protein n=1 Tax=Malus domestica TaxID=3750 RepID=A0A498KIN7_MALDO|nr:hypothetical protein DVH24_006530 [Malus domestica]
MFVEEMNLKQWVANTLLSEAIVEVVGANLLVTQEEDNDFMSKIDCLSSILATGRENKHARNCSHAQKKQNQVFEGCWKKSVVEPSSISVLI